MNPWEEMLLKIADAVLPVLSETAVTLLLGKLQTHQAAQQAAPATTGRAAVEETQHGR